MTYAITKAYEIKDLIKSAGGTWDKERKAWIVSEEVFTKLNDRHPAWCRNWGSNWAAAEKTRIAA